MVVVFFFFFKQKTAYEMRISDWSSDVCSSDLEEAEIDVHRLIACRIRPAGDMAEQRAECGFGRGRGRGQGTAGKFGGGEARGDKADRGAFDIAFTAGDLAREADMRRRFQAELPVEQFRRADEAVRSEENKSELQVMRSSYAGFRLKK